MADESGGGNQPIVIKKIVKGGGHHGGAWKVAYADFVTAMMAFFLLLWLLNVSTDEQKNAISNYFDPTHPRVSDMQSGAGGVLGGLTASVDGAMVSSQQTITPNQPSSERVTNAARASGQAKGDQETNNSGELDATASAYAEAEAEIKEEEETELQEVQEALEEAIQKDPELAELAENLMIDMTPEGLRIQIVDSEGRPMFPSGSARMYERTRKLMEQVGKVIQSVPNEISIRGHTDSIPYGANADYTNWELSSDRANASRRALNEAGIPSDRLNNVVGKADTEHLLPDDPTNARNRRISIILLREELSDTEKYKNRVEELANKKRREKAPLPNAKGDRPRPLPAAPEELVPSIPKPESGQFKKTDGNVQFP